MNRSLRILVAGASVCLLLSLTGCDKLSRLFRNTMPEPHLATAENAISMAGAAKSDAIVVTVSQRGDVYLGTSGLNFHQLTPKVRDRLTNTVDKTVFLRIDSGAGFGSVKDVMEALRMAGADQLGLVCRSKAEIPQRDDFGQNHTAERPVGLYVTALPGAKTPKTIDATVLVYVVNGPAGVPLYKINQADVQKAELEPKLTDIYRNRAERILFITADDDVRFQTVAEVIDVATSATVDQIALNTNHLGTGK